MTLSTIGGTDSMASASYSRLRAETHKALLDRVDLEVMSKMLPERLKEELRLVIEVLLGEAGAALNALERRQMVSDIQNEVLGHGPIEPLLHDPTVSDILINGSQQIFVERAGRIEPTDLKFDDDAHLMRIIDKIVSRVGRRIDESSPMVDARLPDGSRVNAIIPPLAIDGPSMSIRRFAVIPLKMDDLVRSKSVPAVFAELLSAMVKAKLNILISGGTGSGKTTMLNVLSGFIPEQERIITIEDAAELQLQQAHVIRLETRPPNIEGKGEVSQRALVKNSLRMRPDRIVLGEVRAGEAFDMLQAMNTGHEGSMATVHANTPRDALARLENMLGMAGLNLPPKAMRQQIASAITAVVQLSRLTDGQRKLMSISEITGMEGEVVTMQEIFSFQQTGIGAHGEVLGYFKASGVRPRFLDRVLSYGIKLPEQMFDPSKSHAI
jgi:pilus assembly protein CpaF